MGTLPVKIQRIFYFSDEVNHFYSNLTPSIPLSQEERGRIWEMNFY